MFFLARSAFWLGLTFWMLGGPVDPPSLVRSAGVGAASLAQGCVAAPDLCATLARRADDFAARPAAPHAHAHPRADTLSAADFATPWRGRS